MDAHVHSLFLNARYTNTRTEAHATHHLGDIAGTITEEALLCRRVEEVVQRGYHLLQSLQTLSTARYTGETSPAVNGCHAFYLSIKRHLQRCKVGEELHIIISLHDDHQGRPVGEPSNQEPRRYKDEPHDGSPLGCERENVFHFVLLRRGFFASSHEVDPNKSVDMNDVLQ